MSTPRTVSTALLISCCAATSVVGQSTGPSAAVSYSNAYNHKVGDSNAGAEVFASTFASAKKAHSTSSPLARQSTYSGEGHVDGLAYLDAQFLGSSRRVAHFAGTLHTEATFTYVPALTSSMSCSTAGGVWLAIGGTTVWNQNFTNKLNAGANLTLRIASPSLPIFLGVPAALDGYLDGSINTSVDLEMDPCSASADFESTARASASGGASLTLFAPVPGGATASFVVGTQELKANIDVRPPALMNWTDPNTWVTGKVTYSRGPIFAVIVAWAYVPWKVSETLASFYQGSAFKTLFDI